MNRSIKKQLDRMDAIREQNRINEMMWKEADGDVQARQNTDHEEERSEMDRDSAEA